MGVTEVTQSQWQEVMGDNPSFYVGANHPVESVSWNRIQQFLDALNGVDQAYVYRLPTEAEWEYACRAGEDGEFYYGDDPAVLDNYAVYGRAASESHAPVKSKIANEWGLYDMMGNVGEWTSDWFDATYYANSPYRDPVGPDSGDYRVFRSGSYDDGEVNMRCAYRSQYNPTNFRRGLGFRLVAFSRTR